MKKKINNKLIRLFNPCYDPKKIGIAEGELLTIRNWIEKYRNTVKNKEDVIWLVCRPEFMSDRDCRLFAVWCAREALKLIEAPDERIVNACNVAERFANNQATNEELAAARAAAWDAARDVAWDAARAAARATTWGTARDAAWGTVKAAAWAAARDATWDAAWDATWDAQIDHLLTYFP